MRLKDILMQMEIAGRRNEVLMKKVISIIAIVTGGLVLLSVTALIIIGAILVYR